jgi:phosphoglycolate phosphatase
MTERFVLFDFDGVITDSFGICLESAKVRCPNVTEDAYRALFEGNIHDRKAEIEHGPDCRLDVDFYSLYIPKMMAGATAYPGIPEAVKDLSSRYALAIVSSTDTEPVRELLEKFGLSYGFRDILGRDVHTSKVEKIKMIFGKYGTTAERCIFVTDTLGDIEEATHAGVSSIAVPWGFHGRERLERGNPFRIVDRPEDLPATIDAFFGKSA